MARIEEREAGGIPLLFARVDGPAHAALVFRVGRGDETFARAGVTHLVEHLALFTLGQVPYDFNGFVDETATTFYASGRPEEAAAFLTAVAGALQALPLERLELEKRVLRTEESGTAPGVDQRLLAHRVGLTGYGSGAYSELGLRSLTEDEVAAWARERFVRRACVICWAGPEPPEDLALSLPDGELRQPPPPAPLPGLPLPLAVMEGTGGIAAGMVAPRSHAAALAFRVAERRLHRRVRLEEGLAYSVDVSWTSLTADEAHVVVGADCLDDHADRTREIVLDVLDELAVHGPASEELAEAVEQRRRDAEDDSAAPALLRDNALRRLVGKDMVPVEEMRARAEAVTPAQAAAEMAAALQTMILVTPEDAPPPPSDRFHSLAQVPAPEPVREGREFQTKGLRPSRRDRLVVGDEGISLWLAGEPEPATVRWAQLAAATRESDGSYYLTSLDHSAMVVLPRTFKDEAAVREQIERHLDPRAVVPPPDAQAADAVQRLAAQTLPKQGRVRSELSWLPEELADGEELLALAEAMRGIMLGLLAVTDRRVLFLYEGGERKGFEHLHRDTTAVRSEKGITGSAKLLLTGPDGEELTYAGIEPAPRAEEMADLIAARVSR